MKKCQHDRGAETSRYFTLPSALLDITNAALNSSGISGYVARSLEAREDRDLSILGNVSKIEEMVRDAYRLDRKALDEIQKEFGTLPYRLPRTPLSEEEERELLEGYSRSIEEVIDEEVEEGGGSRVITKKAYFANRQLELMCEKLQRHPEVVVAFRRRERILPAAVLWHQAAALSSYAIGSAFGRWDIRYATFERHPADIPDPFDPLPVCPPGMLTGTDGLPVNEAPSGYRLRINWDGILVDDPDHSDDIVRRVREGLELIWKDRADAIEKEACDILGVKELRDYFRKPGSGGFWDDHVKRYSNSRRKAPIYWLLQSSKKNYALWLYYHQLDKDLLFKAMVNYVEPKIRLEDSRLETLRTQKAAAGGSGRDARRLGKEVEQQEEFLSELRDFEDKLRRVANLHLEPDLNDGVVLNIAPLWELVPWKEAKKYSDELMEGKYEWSSIGKQLRQKGLVK
jgi:hypothetical protein